MLCCTAAHLPPIETWTDRAATVRAEGMAAVADAALERWFTPQFRSDHPGVAERFRADLLDTPPEGYAGCCEAIGTHDVRDRLGSIRAPTLVISGGDDPATPPELGRELANGIEGARFEVLPEARHLASAERAGEVNEMLLDHLSAGART